MGYKLAGFNVIGCCEIDQAMIGIYRKNNHPKYSYCADVRDLLSLDLPEELYDLDILDGSPPCSVFSMAGGREAGWGKEKKFREGQELQRLDDLFFAFIDIAKALRPKVVVAENVHGLILGNARGYVNEIFKGFDEAGYDVQLFLLNAALMGVPQARERVVFIARRKDLSFPKISLSFNERPICFGEVRDERGKEVAGITGEMLKYRRITDRDISDISKRTRRIYSGYTCPINRDDQPVRTITSGGGGAFVCMTASP